MRNRNFLFLTFILFLSIVIAVFVTLCISVVPTWLFTIGIYFLLNEFVPKLHVNIFEMFSSLLWLVGAVNFIKYNVDQEFRGIYNCLLGFKNKDLL